MHAARVRQSSAVFGRAASGRIWRPCSSRDSSKPQGRRNCCRRPHARPSAQGACILSHAALWGPARPIPGLSHDPWDKKMTTEESVRAEELQEAPGPSEVSQGCLRHREGPWMGSSPAYSRVDHAGWPTQARSWPAAAPPPPHQLPTAPTLCPCRRPRRQRRTGRCCQWTGRWAALRAPSTTWCRCGRAGWSAASSAFPSPSSPAGSGSRPPSHALRLSLPGGRHR